MADVTLTDRFTVHVSPPRFKMDYGGHDSSFHDNLVVNYPYDGQRCLNLGGGFKAGHGDAFYNNTCVVGIGGTRK